jgi:hypothetical protein
MVLKQLYSGVGILSRRGLVRKRHVSAVDLIKLLMENNQAG